MVLPLLIGAGVSLIGGAMRNSAAKRQSNQQYQNDLAAQKQQRKWDLEDRKWAQENPTVIKSEVDYAKMVADAEAAGFNPLTALRNGGSAGFASMSQPSAPLSRQAPVRQAVGGSPMGDAFSAMGDFIANFDPHRDNMREMETRLVEAQIANLNASTQRAIRFGDVPTYTAGTIGRTMGAGVGHGEAPALSTAVLPPDAGRSFTPEIGIPTVTNPTRTGNRWWHIDPGQPDAQSWEERYGEPGDWAGGAANAVTDTGYNVRRWPALIYDEIARKTRGLPSPPPRRTGPRSARSLGGGGGGW